MPLGNSNQNWCGVKLLPMSISTYPVDCVHLRHLLRAQYHCLCPNGREGPPLACPPTPTTPPPPTHPLTHPLMHDTHDITRGCNSKTSSKILCGRICYETLATYKTALLIQQIWHGYNVASTGEPQLLQHFKLVAIS